MPLSWNEIRSRALAFSKEWEGESSEEAEAQTFWAEFLNIFGINRRRVATFEKKVKKLDESDGSIDLFWPRYLLTEHKSLGKSLDKAYQQAIDYLPNIPENELPRYIVVTDFATMRLHNLEEDMHYKFSLTELHKNIELFSHIAGYKPFKIREELPVNIKAAERMGKLHDLLEKTGYDGKKLEVFLVRLLFCLFAEDTELFKIGEFQNYIENHTREDGSDLAMHLRSIFEVLNKPTRERVSNLDDDLANLPHVNGKLFEENLDTPSFDREMRSLLLSCCELDWGKISPAIFGALFQSIMDREARRNLGAHYTSEQNILKVINPLFMDELHSEFNEIHKGRRGKVRDTKLHDFHDKLTNLKFLDPACGCGNFLVIAYRELRQLELEVLMALYQKDIEIGQMALDVEDLIKVNVNQFYGVELEEFPAQIAQTALWLMDHQMNLIVSEAFGKYFNRIPLVTSATIARSNALTLDWEEVIPASDLDYIMGNPPFIGARIKGKEQLKELEAVFREIKGVGLLDYVTGWYAKIGEYMGKHDHVQCALVSTNSICSGEQVGVLWPWLFDRGFAINFAHRPFIWSNEARGKAKVHCVIVGFGRKSKNPKRLFDYEDMKGDPMERTVENINPYLTEATNVTISRRSVPLCEVPELGIGNKPIDGGNYIFSTEEKSEFIHSEPASKKWFKRFIGAKEFLNSTERWFLWLGDCPPNEINKMPQVRERVEAVRRFRLGKKLRKLAETPTRLHVENMPSAEYIAIPKTSSETRKYIPFGFYSPETMCSDAMMIAPNVTGYHFGVLTSIMHNAWMRAVCGRFESRYRYSIKIVYNNFPWPKNISDKQKKIVASKAQAVLYARAEHPNSSLADLYNPISMPKALLDAHHDLDKAVDASYRRKKFDSEAERVAFLFELYDEYTKGLV